MPKTPEEIAAYRNEWRRMDYQRNPEKYRERARKWAAEHRDVSRARAREYARNHRAEARDRWRAWAARPENREKINEASRAYLKAHPEHRQKYEAVRRALRKGATVELVDRDVVLANYVGRCGWCSEPVDPANFHVDHIVALVHGGEHSYANTQPVHPACNYQKRTVLKERAA